MALLTIARRQAAIALVVCAVSTVAVKIAAAPAQAESNVKAVFLFNFAKYVTWPAMDTSERSPAEVQVCVAGNPAFFALLKAAIQNETADGRPLQAVSPDGLDEARNCQILYVGDTQSADAKAWFSAVRGRQVLTVGDGALTDDTVIAFVRDDNRIRFDINRVSASRRGLNVSAKLLRLARQVKDR